MAKKKRKKKPPRPRKAQAAEDPEGAKAAPPKRAEAELLPTERRQRKEEVRREKERELRRWQRRQRGKKVAAWVAVAAAIAGGVFLVNTMRSKQSKQLDTLLDQAAAAAKAAGCGPVEDVGSYDPEEAQDRVHVNSADDLPALNTYASVPAASGPHLPVTLAGGVKDEPPDIGETIHSLEHGAVVVWYAPDAASDPEIKRIGDFVKANSDHTIMAPYEYKDEGDAGKLPSGKQMALVAWHHVQLCNQPSLPVVAKFLSEYREPPLGGGSYKGNAPEPGTPI